MRTATVVVRADAREPDWVRTLRADAVDPGGVASLLRQRMPEAVLIDAESVDDPLAVARGIHAADPDVQIVVIVPPEQRRAIERAMLFTPGLGEIWIASRADAAAAISDRAAGVTRQRRTFTRTRQQLEAAVRVDSPQRALRALISDAILAGLFQVVPDPVLTVDASHRIVSANAAAERLFGRLGRGLVGQRMESVATLSVPLSDVLNAELVRQDVEFAPAPDAATLPHSGELTVVPLGVPRESLWAVLLHDVSERERARRLLEAQARELESTRAAAEAARERVERLQRLTAALSGTVTREDVAQVVVNEALPAFGADAVWLALAEFESGSGEEVLRTIALRGLPHGASGLETMPLEAPTILADAVRTGQAAFVTVDDAGEAWRHRYPQSAALARAHGLRFLCAIPVRSGEYVRGALGIAFRTPRGIPDGERAIMVAFGEQCGQALERARLFVAEQTARAEAETANRAKADFLATMSHELRTPLNAIAGYVQLMAMGLRGPITDTQRDDLERIRRSQEHLLGLINDVLNFARLEAGHVQFTLEAVPLKSVLDDVEAVIRPQVEPHGHVLNLVPCPPTLAAWADRERVQQVLLNLLSNAVKYTEPGGRITVECTPTRHDGRDLVQIRVSDTGIGIPEDKLAFIFEPFVQIGRELNRPAEGVGLGLAISRDLARQMDGELRAESTAGEGSTFTLTLPRAPAEPRDA